jgi:hypothetical protein
METAREDSPEPRVIAADKVQEGDEEARTRERGKQREKEVGRTPGPCTWSDSARCGRWWSSRTVDRCVGKETRAEVDDETYLSYISASKETVYEMSRRLVPAIIHVGRREKLLLNSAVITAIALAIGLGCVSVAELAAVLHLSPNLVQVPHDMHAEELVTALSSVLVPNTLTATIPAAGVHVPGSRRS